MMEKWILITNPGSASATTKARWSDCENMLADAGLSVEVKLTERPGHAIQLAQEAAEAGCRKVIAGGGDGTIHEVMTGLLRFCDEGKARMADFTLAVLPLGTGNDWIRSAGIPEDLDEAVKCVVRGKTAKEDVVR